MGGKEKEAGDRGQSGVTHSALTGGPGGPLGPIAPSFPVKPCRKNEITG